MTSTVVRWGELPNSDPDTESGIAAIEREHITKPRPMELDGPLLHQPVKREQTGPSDVPIECTFGGPLIMHSIHLNFKYAKKMRTVLNSLQQQQQNQQENKPYEETDIEVPFLPTSPVMEFTEREMTNRNQSIDRCFESKFRRGIGEMQPEINEQLAKKILRKALAVMCAHAGFETTSESILEILVDVTSEFYLKLTRLLRATVDREVLVGGTNFPDALEEVFYNVGIGSMTNLCTFYQTRVIDYHSHLLKTCQQLGATYKQIKSSDLSKENELKKEIEVKEEEAVAYIHFPTTDEQDDGQHSEAASLHLDELPNLQITFEQEAIHITTEGDETKNEHSSRSDLILHLATNDVPNLYQDDEIVNVIDSPVQSQENTNMSSDHVVISDPHLSAMLDQPHTPVHQLDMKLFKGRKNVTTN